MAISHAVGGAPQASLSSESASISVVERELPKSYLVCKRVFDVTVSSVALVVLFPLFLAIAIGVAITGGGPVLYKQGRVGRGGKIIQVLKFRTMVRNADEVLRRDPELYALYMAHLKLRNDPRVTGFGRFLRRTTLDELPQLINVFRGEMSIVGPRPIIPSEWQRYGEPISVYLQMKPGCAGIWQCSGRNELCYERRVEMDVEYYRRASGLFDLLVILKTAAAVLRGRGAY